MTFASGLKGIIFGATSGIGKGLASKLIKDGSQSLTLVARSASIGNEMVRNTNNAFESVDLSDLSKTRAFCRDFKQKNSSLDFIVLSAGGITSGTRSDGEIDKAMALNYYSRYLIMKELSELVSKSPCGRIIVICNPASGKIVDRNDLLMQNNYSFFNFAFNLAMYLDLAVDHFAGKYPHLKFVHLFPGILATKNKDNGPWWARLGGTLIAPILPSGDSFAPTLERVLTEDLQPGLNFLSSSLKPVAKANDHTEENKRLVIEHTEAMLEKY